LLIYPDEFLIEFLLALTVLLFFDASYIFLRPKLMASISRFFLITAECFLKKI